MLSEETGCWLYLAGQGVNSKEAFVNFTSQRLARDRPEQFTQILKLSSEMFAGLITARRADSTQLAVKLAEMKASAETKELEFAQKEAAFAREQREKDERIAELERMLMEP